MSQDQLLTTDEAAGRMAVSARTVKRLMFRGELGFYKIDGATRISEKEIARYLRSRERRARAA